MYTLLADESNRTRIDGEFFIYGGIFLKTEYLGQLADGVVAVRNKYELPADAALKFSLPNKPPDMEIQKFHDMRTDVLRLVAELSGKMIVYVVLHDLARSKSAEETQRMGMNSILNRYANFLDRNDTWGLAMIDQDNEVFKNIREIHQMGLTVENRKVEISPKIAGVLAFDSNGTHIASAADIAVSAFRYCVNSLPKEGRDQEIQRIVASRHWNAELSRLLPLQLSGTLDFTSPNVMLRPITVLASKYKVRYDALEAHFKYLTESR